MELGLRRWIGILAVTQRLRQLKKPGKERCNLLPFAFALERGVSSSDEDMVVKFDGN